MRTEFAAASDTEAHLIGWVDETRTNKKLGPALRPHNEVLRFYRQYCRRYAVVCCPGRGVTAVALSAIGRLRLLAVFGYFRWLYGSPVSMIASGSSRLSSVSASGSSISSLQRFWISGSFSATLISDNGNGLSIVLFFVIILIFSSNSVAVWRQSLIQQYRDGQMAKV